MVYRIVSAIAVVGAMAALLVGASPASASAINWAPCSEPALQEVGAECGYLAVPLNYSDPTGAQIQLAVSRIEHTSSDYQGVIVTNPGGPGGEGLNLNTYLIPVLKQEGFTGAADDYDWIGFDPRGVGASIPAISCEPNYEGPDRPSYVPYNRQLLDTWLSRSQQYAHDCGSASPLQAQLLQNMSTRDNALDLDSIRQALGQSQITYYGFSWGTDLGQVYATLFPSHVRRLILDSNVDPLRDGFEDFNIDQDYPFNRNENIWFGWLAKYNSVYHLGSTEWAVQNLFYTTEHQLESHPADGVVGPDEWTDIFLFPAYYQQTWVPWAQAFSNWINDHNAAAAEELVDLYQVVDEPGDDNELAVYLSVLCTDSQWPTNWGVWEAATWATFRVAPLEAWGNTWFNAPCAYWPAPAQQHVAVNGYGVKSALLIDETLDGATPFEGSLVTRQLFPHSVLVAEPGGTSHANSLSGNLCVDGTIANYLETGALPPRIPWAPWDKTCAPSPQPVPPSSSSAAQASAEAAAGALARLGTPAARIRLPPAKAG
jgi:pimeloyl-ACP methyl ester carboxylesterase